MKFINKKLFLKYLPQILAMLFFAGFVAYAWTEPPQAPPDGNVDPPINVGSASQLKSGALGIGGVLRGYADAIFDGKVGIGTISPSQLLHLKSSASDAAIRLQANNSAADQTATFNFTGGPQTWTVPAWVTSINVSVKGAQGNAGSDPPGGINHNYGQGAGLGAIVSGTLSVIPGEILTIQIGGQNGYNGGNGGGGGGGGAQLGGAGGTSGGFSNVSRGATLLAVAGGGGGGGGGGSGCGSCVGGPGGSGGLNGDSGTQGSGPPPWYPCGGNSGGGGTQFSGGTGGGTGSGCLPNAPGFNGVAFWGGGGGTAPTNIWNGNGAGGGGGGGGGYYGGGGANSGGYSSGYTGAGGGGGGGGSSLVPVGGSVSAGQTGNGHVVITYSSSPDTNWILGVGPSTNGKFKISNSSAFGTTDALVLDDQGIILKAFNGSNCYRIRIDNSGTFSSISVACP